MTILADLAPAPTVNARDPAVGEESGNPPDLLDLFAVCASAAAELAAAARAFHAAYAADEPPPSGGVAAAAGAAKAVLRALADHPPRRDRR
jgi:hypothetical protein